jgi:hypothetical protein
MMSRSGYSDDCENLALYREAVDRALHGKRGQAFLRRLIASLDAMPDKRLGAGSFQRGECPCTLGALAAHEGIDIADLEPDGDPDGAFDDNYVDGSYVGARFDIARSMAAEVMYENDEAHYGPPEAPQDRWQRMRGWASRLLAEVPKV